ncbi:pyruvate,water dikinase [Streptosporangium becharense]|uniref:Pyruvate,water dikinase n=1 Tax=Streptosporangium becharense TaxID=1816182 RepID=A0A7W9MJS0_9ACTN|nr:PEP/pyruvate-binding domain-containing protein [Streptosporangium becharense]MBB2914411.1 pyruvate,water dikinase [Streptosporangium becharense]MBB5823557.1 pyruvate,water dikinase [Streptosporangium becharense]
MIVPLMEAVADTCGGKAGALGALLRAGLPVPDGFVVSFAAYLDAVRDPDLGRFAGRPDDPDAIRQAIEARPVHATVIDALGRALDELGDPPVAVRSSAANEDTGQASAAGQHESFLAVHGVSEVAEAVRACWASLFSPRAVDYRDASVRADQPSDDLMMAVIVQRHLDAEASGVMFTPADPDDPTRIEASWGLGPSVVEGKVTPDAYRVTGDRSVTRAVADKRTRLDRRGTRLVIRDVPTRIRNQPAIDDATATRLAGLGKEIAALLGGPQDIEWAIADGRTWILQARPVTAAPPPASPRGTCDTPAAALTGTPGSRGIVTGIARIVRGPGDFARVRPGDILVCPFTDPAWTPLLRIAAGVVTETGGVLSHAAIVAREHAIPAVLGVPDATGRLHDDTVITVDGTTGTVTATNA